jgi:hypothetical protein
MNSRVGTRGGQELLGELGRSSPAGAEGGDVVEKAERGRGRGLAPGQQGRIEPLPPGPLGGDRQGDRLQDRLLPPEQPSGVGPRAVEQRA